MRRMMEGRLTRSSLEELGGFRGPQPQTSSPQPPPQPNSSSTRTTSLLLPGKLEQPFGAPLRLQAGSRSHFERICGSGRARTTIHIERPRGSGQVRAIASAPAAQGWPQQQFRAPLRLLLCLIKKTMTRPPCQTILIV